MTIPSRQEGAFHRAPRPLIGWVGVFLLAVCTVFAAVVMTAIALGFWKTAAEGEAVPDFTGGLAVLIGALVPAWGMVAQYMSSRSRERRDSIAFGGQAPAPFDSGSPSETGSVNPHGGPAAP